MKIRVQIKGKEKLIINLLKSLKVNIYNIKYINNKSIYTINKSDLKKIPKEFILDRSLTIIEIYHKHNTFIKSILISFILISFLSNIIISIKINHNDKFVRTIIKKEMYKYGLRPFTMRKSFNKIDVIKKRILHDKNDYIDWIEIIPRGMNYTVNVEKRIINKSKNENKYCDIVSKKDAIITSIHNYKGQNVLDLGDSVKKGDTIISGDITFNEEVKAKVCASGYAIGNTWYNVNISYPLYKDKKIYTGKYMYNIGIKKSNHTYSLLNIHFKNYNYKNKLLFKIGKIKIYKQLVREYKIKRKKLNYKDGTNEAKRLAKLRFLTTLKTHPKIVDEKVLQTYEYNSIINMDIFYSVDEIISVQVNRNEKEG